MSSYASIVPTLLAVTAVGGVQPGVEGMNEAPKPWFRLVVGEGGRPAYEHSDGHTRVQREVLWNLYTLATDLATVAEIERELGGALTGRPKDGGYGYSFGGPYGFHFKPDGRAIVWFEYDSEAEGDDRYPTPARELEMPLADFAAVFRAWAESVRHWRALGGENGVPLPAEKRPKCYPPPAAAG